MATEPVNERPIFPQLGRADAHGVSIWSVSMIRQLTTVFQQYGYRLNRSITEDTALLIANNLSDLADAAAARTNLGLGDAATRTADAPGNLLSVQSDLSGSNVTTATGTQPLDEALDDRVVHQESVAAMQALTPGDITVGQQFAVKGTIFVWNGSSFLAATPINVEAFGATGDGTTDDTAAIQAAIDFAFAGDTVYCPSPTTAYRVESAITINKRITVEGSGARVDAIGAIVGVFNLDAPGAELRGFFIQGDRTANQRAARVSADFARVRDMEIHDVDQGIEVWGGVWHRIEHIRLENIVTTVMTVGNVVGAVVEDLRYDTRGGASEPTTGILLFGEGCVFADLDIINCGTCLHITTSGRSSTWNFFNGCSFDTSDWGLRITNVDVGEQVKGIMFDHCWFSSHRNQGVLLDGDFNTNGISFSDCYIINNEEGGLFVAAASTNVEIKDCTFAANSQAAASTYPSVQHDTVGTVSVMGSHFTDWGILATSVSAAIERTASGSGALTIDGCFAKGSVTGAGFVDNGGGTLHLGLNFDNIPSAGFIPNDTTESTGVINLVSSEASFNTIRGRSTTQSGIQGVTSAAAAFGGVFSNTAGGAGLRVDQGASEFAGAVTFDVDVFATVPITLKNETWTSASLQNSWVNFGSPHVTARFRKLASGLVCVEGLVKDGTTTVGDVIFALPAGYRPSATLVIDTISNQSHARVDVESNGNVTVQQGVSNIWLALNFNFFADQ